MPVAVSETSWINSQQKSLQIKENIVPSVVGMGLRDAIYLLESQGLNVKPVGRGAVTKQSVPAGAKIAKGQLIVIELG